MKLFLLHYQEGNMLSAMRLAFMVVHATRKRKRKDPIKLALAYSCLSLVLAHVNVHRFDTRKVTYPLSSTTTNKRINNTGRASQGQLALLLSQSRSGIT